MSANCDEERGPSSRNLGDDLKFYAKSLNATTEAFS